MGKGQKKKGQTMSLSEFAGDHIVRNPDALPTAPAEDDGFGNDRFGGDRREGREGDRYDRGVRTYENEHGERVEMVSQADEDNNWRGGGGGGFGGGGGGGGFGGGGGDRGGYGGDRGGYGGDRGGYGGDRGGGGFGGDRGGGGDDRGGGGFGGDRGGGGYGGERGGEGGERGGPERERYERPAGFNPRGLNLKSEEPAPREEGAGKGAGGGERFGGGGRGGGRDGGDGGGGRFGGDDRGRPPPGREPEREERSFARGGDFVPRDGPSMGGGGGAPAGERKKLSLAPRTKAVAAREAPADAMGAMGLEKKEAAPAKPKVNPFTGKVE